MKTLHYFISSPMHEVLRVSYCDHPPSVDRPFDVRPSVHIFHVYSLTSANIDQSAPNFSKIYMTVRSRMSSIMGPIRPEKQELFSVELKKR